MLIKKYRYTYDNSAYRLQLERLVALLYNLFHYTAAEQLAVFDMMGKR